MPITASSVNPMTGAAATATQPTQAFDTAAKGAGHAMQADMAGARGDMAAAQGSRFGAAKEGIKEAVHGKLADHNMNKANRQFAGDAASAQNAANAATGGAPLF